MCYLMMSVLLLFNDVFIFGELVFGYVLFDDVYFVVVLFNYVFFMGCLW